MNDQLDAVLTKIRAAGRTCSLLLLFVLLMASLAGAIPAYAAPAAQGGVQRIRFAPGATSAVVDGNVSSGQVTRYVLTALAGQTMTVQPVSTGAPIFVTLFDPSRVVMGSAPNGESWSGRLPATGDYTLAVYPSPYSGYTGFQLRVEITNGSQPPAPAPERIRFAIGAVSAQVTGYLAAASSKAYVLNARAGQVMTVESWTAGGPFRFTVTGTDGAWLGSGDQGERWNGTLPRSGDYQIIVETPTDVSPVSYGLVITIVNAAPAPTPTAAPPTSAVRVRFPPGATNVTLSGYVDRYTPTRYVLRALRGQTMTVRLNTLYGRNTTVTVRDPLGNILGAANRGESWTGYLPATEDYYLDVQAPSENSGDTFSLWVEIR
jgi:hypothetical protein